MLLLVAGSGLYLGGARKEFLGPAMVLSAALWLGLAWRGVEAWRQGRRMVDLLDLPAFLFLAYAAWAVMRGPAPYLGKIEWLSASLYGSVFLTARHQLPSRRGVSWLLLFFVVVALLCTGVGFLHFREATYRIGPVPWLGWEGGDRPDYQARMSGAFGCPNQFGNYGVQGSLAALTLAIWPGLAGPIRWFAGWAAAGLASGVYFSISRGSWLAWVSSHAVWMVRWLRRGPLNWLGRSLVLVMAFAIFAGGWWAATRDAVVAERWNMLVGKGVGWERIITGDGNFRFALAQDGIKIWQSSPWFGTGPASFDLVHLRMESWNFGTRTVFTHNDYINTLSDYGLVGACLVAFFWIGVMGLLWRRGRTRGEGTESDVLAALGWGVVTAMLVHAWVDFNFHVPGTAISCFMLLGFATAVTWPERSSAGVRWINPLGLLLVLILAGTTAWLGGRTFLAWRELPAEARDWANWPEEKIRERLLSAERWDSSCLPVAEVGGDVHRIKLLELFLAPLGQESGAAVRRQEDVRRLAETADRWYREAEKLNPMDDTLRVRRATVLDLLGRFDEAEKLYLHGLKMRPTSRFFLLTYGNHLWRKGDLQGARAQFEKVLQAPGFPPRPGEGNDPSDEARAMLEKVKEQIAKGAGKRQSRPVYINPHED